MQCKRCGEYMSGDGYKVPLHCVNALEEEWWYEPPDSGPYYCAHEDSDDDYYEIEPYC